MANVLGIADVLDIVKVYMSRSEKMLQQFVIVQKAKLKQRLWSPARLKPSLEAMFGSFKACACSNGFEMALRRERQMDAHDLMDTSLVGAYLC